MNYLSGARRQNWTYFPRFLYIYNQSFTIADQRHERDLVFIIFLRDVFFFYVSYKCVLPFVLYKKKRKKKEERDPDLLAWRHQEKKKKLTRESLNSWIKESQECYLKKKKTRNRRKRFSPVTWSKAPKVHHLTGGLLFTQDLN